MSCRTWARSRSRAGIVFGPVRAGKQGAAVPAPSPRAALTGVALVLVTVEPARTANVVAAPRATGACPAGVAAVVKLQTKLLASALPARSLAPVVIVAVYTVMGARMLVGMEGAMMPGAAEPSRPRTRGSPG